MSRNTTLSKEWRELLDVVGGISGVCDALGMSSSTFYRASRGQIEMPPDKKEALQILCDLYDLKNPLKSTVRPFARDLVPLRLLGDAIEKGFPPAPRTIERLRDTYPTEQLIALAESDDTPDTILRAVQALLEDA